MNLWPVLAAAGVLGALAAPALLEAQRRPMDATARQAAPGQFAALPQGTTHYQWHGPKQGPVVVCIHGLTTPSFVWEGLLPALTARGVRVLTYDLFGRGYSDRPRGAQDASFFCRQLNDLLVDQGITGPVTLMGYSMGGAIATSFAAAQPDRVDRLILLAPAGMDLDLGLAARLAQIPLLGDWLMGLSFARNHRKGCESERALPSAVPDMVDRQIAELNHRGFLRSVLSSLRGILGKPLATEHRQIAALTLPVLAVWGAEDQVIPISAKDQLAAWNPGADHVVIAGAGHGVTYTHADQVMAAITPALPG